jgi:hypothetical protein
VLNLTQLQEPFSERMAKDPSCDLGPPVHSWGSWSGTKQLEPWQKTLVGPPVYFWGSWSGTKQFDDISPLDVLWGPWMSSKESLLSTWIDPWLRTLMVKPLDIF